MNGYSLLKFNTKTLGANSVDKLIRDICLEIGKRYEIQFVEIGTDKDHVHFIVQSVPILPVTRIVTIIKNMTARYVLDKIQELKKELWGANLWASGYFASTVGKHGNETAIANYVKKQRRESEYVPIHKDQLMLLCYPDVCVGVACHFLIELN